jgi:TRAP-type C4-dicarboxylate transport system permease small subunit
MAGPSAADRAVEIAERVAGTFLALATAVTFVSVFLRYIFAWAIPDGFDFSRNLIGIVIFWGIAVAGFRGDHICVDLVWSALGPRGRRLMDIFASTVALFCMAVFTWVMAGKVTATRADSVLTFDLHFPVWPYYLVAWLGIVLAVLLLALRLFRLVTGRAADLPVDIASH